jgi:hypothetical protein
MPLMVLTLHQLTQTIWWNSGGDSTYPSSSNGGAAGAGSGGNGGAGGIRIEYW